VPRRPADLDEAAAARALRRQGTLTILHEADALLEGFGCDASTDCCRFGVTGREPWLTAAEFELLEHGIRASGRRLADVAKRGAQSEADDDGEQRCPLLSDAGRCLVYAARPLGCRTFFCERARGPGPQPHKALRALPQRLEGLTPRGSRDLEARPLRAWLRSTRTA
jgi:Fe-S-cluster containining protein